MIPTQAQFRDAVEASGLGLTSYQVEKAAQFAFYLHKANEVQNLTRILGVGEFIQGHLIDSVELLRSASLGKSVVDIGSGSGVPGLLAAAMDENLERRWYLVESEANKAQYLDDTIEQMRLSNVQVLYGRAEAFIQSIEPDTITARAVGTVDKISAWIWNCSTWNNLVLFKSKGWETEWANAQTTRFGKKLTVTHTKDYSDTEKTRYLISLKRS
jgi:16S rRNA (guanine527-N7)-methyltransferase